LLQTRKKSEMHEMLKIDLSDNGKGRTQTSEWFTRFKCGETSLEDCEHSGVPPHVTQMKTWRKSAKLSMKTDKYHF
jgi:hypothetical protein